jgi:RNA polymerase sigma-70 factor (ECF subfamily)
MDAFAAVFEPLRPFVYAVACRLVGEHDANDAVMDVFLKAWKALPGFRGGASLKTWLYRIAHNCATDRLRKTQRERERVVEESEMVERRVADVHQDAPDEALRRREDRALVRAAMAHLSDEHRVALELRYAEELSYSEIAAATGISIGTVMSRLFHAKRKLRGLIGKEFAT